nr:hypothetical protein F8B16_18275 [Acinetobacter baumannii]KAB1651731.1 hypothetical protein F8B06_18280 [Acinetobacter baumannii]
MSINPIELLKEKVSSTILNNQDGYLGEKTNALSKFYPILPLYTTNFTEPLSYQDSAFLKLPKFP